MSSNRKQNDAPTEYETRKLGKGVRGKYYRRFQEATNVVMIDPDLTTAFPNSKAVNDALRSLLASRRRKAT